MPSSTRELVLVMGKTTCNVFRAAISNEDMNVVILVSVKEGRKDGMKGNPIFLKRTRIKIEQTEQVHHRCNVTFYDFA